MSRTPARLGALLGSVALAAGLVACSPGGSTGAGTSASPSGTTPSGTGTSATTGSPTPTASAPTAAIPSAGGTGSASPSTAPSAELARFYDQRPTWRTCDNPYGDTEQCTTVTVPLDYANPGAGTIRLAVNRVRATGTKVGSLLVNPGGPGASGLDYASAADQIVDPVVRRGYDIVGFDPRGVGQSSPVKCLTDAQLDTFIATDPDPDTPAEVSDISRQAQVLATGCERDSARLLPHVGTADAARDMDVIRAVVGDPKLNYLGKSYGTYLGATYAGLFPQRVGRFVLDGAIDPELTSEQLDLGQAQGFQTAVAAFLADWVATGDCPLGDTVAQAQARLGQLLESTSTKPLPTSDGDRELSSGQAFLGVVAPLYDRDAWDGLRAALTEALQGSGDQLLQYSDLYSDRGPDGYTSNANEVIYAVNCLDRPDTAGASEVPAEVPAFEKASPVFGGALAWSSLPCADWPVRSGRTPAAITAAGAGPILVVGTTRDPATPYAWAVSLAGQLESGVLLTRDGDGHTGYLMGNTCVDDKVDAYLVRGTAPADGTRCAAGG